MLSKWLLKGSMLGVVIGVGSLGAKPAHANPVAHEKCLSDQSCYVECACKQTSYVRHGKRILKKTCTEVIDSADFKVKLCTGPSGRTCNQDPMETTCGTKYTSDSCLGMEDFGKQTPNSIHQCTGDVAPTKHPKK